LEGGVLISKANEIAEKMNIEDFQATGGWLEKFKSRNGIRSFKLHGEARSANMSGVEFAREKLPALIEELVSFHWLSRN